MCKKNKKQQEVIIKDIFNLSLLVRKLSLHCNFLSKNKLLDIDYIKNEIKNIKMHVEHIENNL